MTKHLKMIIFILALGIFFRGGGSLAAEADEKTEIWIFHNNPCESCHEETRVMELFEESLYDPSFREELDIQVYYVYRVQGNDKLLQVLTDLSLEKSEIQYPFTVIEDQYYFGDEGVQQAAADVRFGKRGQEASPQPVLNGGQIDGQINDGNFQKTDEIILKYYSTEACTSCEAAFDYLKTLPTEITVQDRVISVQLEEISVVEQGNAEELLALFQLYHVPEGKQQVPIVFIGKNALCGKEEITAQTEALLYQESSRYQAVIAPEADHTANKLGLGQIGSILLAGFVNGFNPCSLSMTLLFLSLLTAVKDRKRFRFLGIGFIGGKFAAYLGLGLLIGMMITAIPFSAFAILRLGMSYFLLVLCVGLALGNFLDFYHVRKQEYGKVRIQLPKKLRKMNETLLTKAVRPGFGKWLFLLVIGAAVLLSLGEFLCTGQIYLAVILSFIQQSGGEMLPSLFFVLYVAMLCVPSIILLILIDKGKGVLTLSAKSLAAMPMIKLVSGLLFLVMALVTIFMI